MEKEGDSKMRRKLKEFREIQRPRETSCRRHQGGGWTNGKPEQKRPRPKCPNWRP